MVKASDFDSDMRRFESFFPCHPHQSLPLRKSKATKRLQSAIGPQPRQLRNSRLPPFPVSPIESRAAFGFFSLVSGKAVFCDRHCLISLLPMLSDTLLFTGNANPALAQEIATHLGIALGKAAVGRFSDGETTVEIQQNVRGREVFVLQSTCAPTNDNLMELLIMVDALKRASAQRITAVIPYFGYARQDRRPRSTRVPISARVVADLLETVGVERVLTMDLHADQIQGFFNIPVDNIYASPVLLSDLQAKRYDDLVVVSPDVGGVVRARALAKQLGCELAIIDKRRPKANVSEVMHIIGEIDGRNCVIMDDMIDTAGTLVKAAEVLKERGAKSVYAYCTHAVFSGPAIERIKASHLDEVVITNTIPLGDLAKGTPKIRQLSTAFLFAETIRRITDGDSVTSLFSEQNNNF